jgi:deoxyribodipyrimidine photo-lyase
MALRPLSARSSKHTARFGIKTLMEDQFPATRDAGLQRLATFVPRAGRDYAAGRNADNGPHHRENVSLLSPYLRHRLITEQEVVQVVLAKHSLQTAEKFIQEVLWRTYWKGWLEMRPAIWIRFIEERDRMRADFPNARALAAAETGATGIEGFDDWARELVETGYLHNHARMWFASIWIFTLRLPWTLGADFFLRHLIDADAASNTSSWRWVAGMQTIGKTYLATMENIERFTGGRFAPRGLAREAVALAEGPLEPPAPLPEVLERDHNAPSLLLVTPDDMCPETLFAGCEQIKAALVVAAPGLSWGERSACFVAGAAEDTAERVSAYYHCPARVSHDFGAAGLIEATEAAKVRQIVTSYAPVGPVADAIRAITPAVAGAGIALCQVRRPWDNRFWPHAKKGYFPFKERVPEILREDGLI